MEKKISDEELEKLLEEQYIKEADLLEEALFSDENEENQDEIEETDEEVQRSYEQLVQRLKAEGVYREEDASAGQKVLSLSTEMKKDNRKNSSKEKTHTFKIARAAGFVVVCVLGVFAASMTSEANRKYFVERIQYLAGDDARILVDTDSEKDSPNQDESFARKEIEEKLNVELPEFMYRPNQFEFYDYVVEKSAGIAVLEYMYDDWTLALNIEEGSSEKDSSNFVIRGSKIDTIFIKEDNILITISEIRDKKDGNTLHLAQWEYEDTYFQFIGNIDEEEIKKIITNIRY